MVHNVKRQQSASA